MFYIDLLPKNRRESGRPKQQSFGTFFLYFLYAILMFLQYIKLLIYDEKKAGIRDHWQGRGSKRIRVSSPWYLFIHYFIL
jgi:hypothetical protein